MRATVGFSAPSTAAAAGTTAFPPSSSSTHPLVGGSQSAWHSPVPYLFGGLAAMLGLIAFALLTLACSYWKLSGHLDASDDAAGTQSGSGANGAKPTTENTIPYACYYEERIVVIMAGDEKPTFLATPVSNLASSSFNDCSGSRSGSSSHPEYCDTSGGEVEGKEADEGGERLRQEDESSRELLEQNAHAHHGQQ